MLQAANARLQLLIFQATPFCNIDCKYCYLPNRLDKRRISLSLVSCAVGRVIDSGLLGDNVSVVWHAGEPLTVGPGYLEQLIDACDPLSRVTRVQHRVQTNATLIDARFCETFRTRDVRIGVSIDGPQDLHDQNRMRRNRSGTFKDVMRGIDTLHQFGVRFDAICVLTSASLDRAEELYDFFTKIGASTVGFNIDELEGANLRSSICSAHSLQKLADFWDQMLRIHFERRAFRLREADTMLEVLRYGRQGDERHQLVDPFTILTIGVDGSVGTFCPELLGQKHLHYGDFSIGNIQSDSLADLTQNARFIEMKAEIHSGVLRCKHECKYFDLCGGGAPSNKMAERGSFDVAETIYCKATKKTVIDSLIKQVRIHRTVKAASSLKTTIWTVPNALDTQLCADMIATLDSSEWRPGVPALDGNGRHQDTPTRSFTPVHVNADRILAAIRPSIPLTIEDTHFVGLSTDQMICLRYLPGDSFPTHVDSPTIASATCYSLFTVIIYLNHGYEGGQTYFPDCDVVIQPVTGMALVFAHGVRHGGQIIHTGVKYALLTYLLYDRD